MLQVEMNEEIIGIWFIPVSNVITHSICTARYFLKDGDIIACYTPITVEDGFQSTVCLDCFYYLQGEKNLDAQP